MLFASSRNQYMKIQILFNSHPVPPVRCARALDATPWTERRLLQQVLRSILYYMEHITSNITATKCRNPDTAIIILCDCLFMKKKKFK